MNIIRTSDPTAQSLELIACESCGGPAVGYWPTPFGRAWRCETDRNHDQESGFDRSRFVEVA